MSLGHKFLRTNGVIAMMLTSKISSLLDPNLGKETSKTLKRLKMM